MNFYSMVYGVWYVSDLVLCHDTYLFFYIIVNFLF